MLNQRKRVLAFIALAIACFLTVLDGTIVNVSLPSMAEHYGTDMTGISWVSTAYLIPFSALLINFSKIADLYGRKRLFLIGLVVFGAASVCCGLSESLGMLIGFRALQGIGAAILTPLAIPLGVELFGKSALGKLAVIIGMIISVSAAAGPVIGGILNETFGFQSIFYVNTPFILIALVFGAGYVIECYDNTAEKQVNVIGSIFLATGLGSLTFFLIKGNDYGWGSRLIVGAMLLSLLSLIGFGFAERRSKSPMIDISLFRSRMYSASIALIAIIFFAYMPIAYLMNFYLENALGYSVLKSGLMLGIVSAVSFVTAPLFSLLSHKTSPRVVSTLAVFFVSAGNLSFVLLDSSNPLPVILSAFVLLGLGVGAITPLYQSAFQEISPDKNGMASGLLNSLRQLTACIAIALVATMSSRFTGEAIDTTKQQMVERVESSTVLEQQEKMMVDSYIQQAQAGFFSQEDIATLLQQQMSSILANTPQDQQAAVMEKLMEQKQGMDELMDDYVIIYTEQRDAVYQKCFFVIGILSALGFLAVPFNKRKKQMDEDN